jgi:hypothetical protein
MHYAAVAVGEVGNHGDVGSSWIVCIDCRS